MLEKCSRWVTLALLVALTALAVSYAARHLTVDGDASRLAIGDAEAFAQHLDFLERFEGTGTDAVIAVFADDLADELGPLEDFVISLQFGEGVAGVVSLFALPVAATDGAPFLASAQAAALPPAERLDRLWHDSLLGAGLLAEDRSVTLLTVGFAPDTPFDTRAATLAQAVADAPPELEVVDVSLMAVNNDISEALKRDQIVVGSTAVAACLILCVLLFRSLSAALICGLPTLIGLTWSFGLLAASGIPLDPLIAIVPTVLLVLGFADGAHMYHAIAVARTRLPLGAAIRAGVIETLPANILTTATTAIAFLSLFLVGAPSLRELGAIGAAGLFVQLVAVVIGVPVLARVLGRGRMGHLGFAGVVRAAHGALRYRRALAIASLALLGVLGVLQTQTRTGYDITEHISRTSPLRDALARIEAKLPGTDTLFVTIDAADPARGVQPADIDRLSAVARVLYDTDLATSGIDASMLDGPLARRFAAADGSGFALPVPVPLGGSSAELTQFADALAADLDAAGLGEVTAIAGSNLLGAREIPRLVDGIGQAFYYAVIVVTLLIGALMRSLRIALVSVVPNLIPIFVVGAGLVLTGAPMTFTGAIALTVAFGIAVDDTIHLLNRYRIARRAGHGAQALGVALTATTPPLVMTSLLLIVGFSITLLSSLPSLASFGTLVALAVGVAMVADLFLFPSLLALIARNTETTKP